VTTLTGEGWLNRPVGVPVPSARLWAEIRVPIPDVAVRPLMARSSYPSTALASCIADIQQGLHSASISVRPAFAFQEASLNRAWSLSIAD